ncbi:LPS-assembly protein LptD [Cyanobium sp. FGCU-52]|nr:LPS-assembly protein LptD [Cyanobium sp. FGCU52]
MPTRLTRVLPAPARLLAIVVVGALPPLAFAMARALVSPSLAAPSALATAQAAPAIPSPPAAAAAAAPAPAAPAPTGMVTIESDSQQADNRTGIVTATGNVRITYPDKRMVATSRQAQYFSKEGRLVLSGDVDVVDEDGQRIRAERMVYRLDDERLVAEPPAGRQVYSRLRLQTRPAAAPAPIVP